MRGVIPLRHLRSDPPPEVMGIAMDSSLPSALESESSAGRVLEVTLLGAPNAGKSSLANALLQSRVRPSRAACRVVSCALCAVDL
jgi:ribosome biogenesis GTPase A